MAWLRRERRGSSGSAAEGMALRFLEAKGMRLIERNFRCRVGEIDLIMQDGDSLVFVEVRLRSNGNFDGNPAFASNDVLSGNVTHVSAAESISHRKQARIVAAANQYLAGKREVPCRFDCILLDKLDPDGIEWIRNAFGA
jgi:putative endonuclease